MSSEAIAAPASLIWASVQRVNFDGWWAMVVSFFLKIVSNLDRSIVSMLAPETKFSLALSDSQIGLAKGAAFAVFYAVFLPLWWAADRFVQPSSSRLAPACTASRRFCPCSSAPYRILLVAVGLATIGFLMDYVLRGEAKIVCSLGTLFRIAIPFLDGLPFSIASCR